MNEMFEMFKKAKRAIIASVIVAVLAFIATWMLAPVPALGGWGWLVRGGVGLVVAYITFSVAWLIAGATVITEVFS